MKKTITTVLMLLIMATITFAATAAPTAPPQEPPTAEQQQWAAAIQEFIDRMITDDIYQRDKAINALRERDDAVCAASFTNDACVQRWVVLL